MRRFLIAVLIVVSVSGCETVDELINPWESEFSCVNNPEMAPCMSHKQAYMLATEGEVQQDPDEGKNPAKNKEEEKENEARSTIKSAELKDDSERTPLVVPGEYRRVYFKEMVVNGMLVSPYYVYYELRPWKWNVIEKGVKNNE